MSLSTQHSPGRALPALSWRRLLHMLGVVAVGVLLFAAGCGGGGGGSSMGTAGNLSVGPITGFGSIIVNKVRFDVSNATVTDDDDNATSSDDLQLGMEVEVESGEVDSDDRAVATHVSFSSAVLGPVSAIDMTAKTLTVLGQTVKVTVNTVFGRSITGGLSGIKVGDIVNVHGPVDTTTTPGGTITATRIDLRPGALFYRLRGVVSNLNTTAMTLDLGGQHINYAKVAHVPENLANGVVLRALLETTQVNGFWIADALRPAMHREPEENNEAEVEGFVTAFTSTSSFSVNGLPVDASKASFPDGSAGLMLGARVEVQGSIVNGVLVATRVEVEDESAMTGIFEIHGAIMSVDTTAMTFMLRGLVVNYKNATFSGGTAADLKVGALVIVHGTLSADGQQIVATNITFGSD